MNPEIESVLAGKTQGCVVCGDCLEILPTLPDGCVDLVLTDPPYVGLKGNVEGFMLGGVAERNRAYQSVGDEWGATLQWVPEGWRVTRLGLMSFCSYHFVAEIAALLPSDRKVALFTWDKVTSPLPINNVPQFTTEFVWAWRKSPGLQWRQLRTMLRENNLTAGCISTGERLLNPDGTAFHKTQKPLALMLQLLSVGGDIVLDCFSGTGTTLVAAKMLGRRYIGIEISPDYVRISKERLTAVDTGVGVRETRNGQLPLFPNKT